MNGLVERTIEAHGGLKRWNEFESVSAHLDGGGALWGLKGHPEMAGETNVTVGTRSEWASHYPFLAARARTRFEPYKIALQNENGELIEELKEPRASFAGHGLETQWSKLQSGSNPGWSTRKGVSCMVPTIGTLRELACVEFHRCALPV
jgi:hypothetical protein